MNACNLWSKILIMVGSIAMLVGALDPMEGSLVIRKRLINHILTNHLCFTKFAFAGASMVD